MTRHERRPADPLAQTAAAGMAALAWLAAQWLTFGILKHSHLLSGDSAGHHHAYAGPAAAVAALVTITAVAGLVVRARFSPANAGPRSGADFSRLRWTFASAAGAAALFVAVEISEFAADAEHHLRPVALVLVLGCVVQGVLALLARSACDAVLRAVDALVSAPQPSTAAVVTRRQPAVGPRFEGVAPLRYGAVLPCRGPPDLTPA